MDNELVYVSMYVRLFLRIIFRMGSSPFHVHVLISVLWSVCINKMTRNDVNIKHVHFVYFATVCHGNQ